MVYMLRSTPPPIEYEADYFFGFYKKQYGKTYLQDFPGLIRTGKERLRRIEALLHPAGGEEERRLLDIGCAYGPFLAAARDRGFSPLGIDPVAEAVRYVREELRIPAVRGFFPLSPEDNPAGEGLFMEGGFTVVSLWYVIEHFENPRRVLAEIYRLLKPGGVLAFSTPSFSGISGRKSPRDFLEKSPPDHWTVWTPRRCGKLLAAYGFSLQKILVTGHHPERFPLIGRFLGGKRGPVYRFFYLLSRIFRLGDTFEVYGVKLPPPSGITKGRSG
jgi:SAM-dependent methyltransferase